MPEYSPSMPEYSPTIPDYSLSTRALASSAGHTPAEWLVEAREEPAAARGDLAPARAIPYDELGTGPEFKPERLVLADEETFLVLRHLQDGAVGALDVALRCRAQQIAMTAACVQADADGEHWEKQHAAAEAEAARTKTLVDSHAEARRVLLAANLPSPELADVTSASEAAAREAARTLKLRDSYKAAAAAAQSGSELARDQMPAASKLDMLGRATALLVNEYQALSCDSECAKCGANCAALGCGGHPVCVDCWEGASPAVLAALQAAPVSTARARCPVDGCGTGVSAEQLGRVPCAALIPVLKLLRQRGTALAVGAAAAAPAALCPVCSSAFGRSGPPSWARAMECGHAVCDECMRRLEGGRKCPIDNKKVAMRADKAPRVLALESVAAALA